VETRQHNQAGETTIQSGINRWLLPLIGHSFIPEKQPKSYGQNPNRPNDRLNKSRPYESSNKPIKNVMQIPTDFRGSWVRRQARLFLGRNARLEWLLKISSYFITLLAMPRLPAYRALP